MSFYFSKSRFVAAYFTCNKHAWLDKYKPQEKSKPNEFTEHLFANGHLVGDLAKQRFNADVDVSAFTPDGGMDYDAMKSETKKHIDLKTNVIAEASFSFEGLFCSVDILKRNDDGSYNIYEVKSSKRDLKKYSKYKGVKYRYILDAAYQQYVLEHCDIKVNKVYILLLSEKYSREETFDLKEYFIECEVTGFTTDLQSEVKDKLLEIEGVMGNELEPEMPFAMHCKDCDYFEYCSRNIPTPSPFDIYDLDFKVKCELCNSGITFFDAPKHANISSAGLKQIEYYNRPNDEYKNKDEIKKFLDSLSYPLYSLDFETYMAVVPEFKGAKTNTAIPFQYSLHIMNVPNGDYSEGSPDLEEKHFIQLSGDPRRAIAESLVRDIPYGACVIACNESTERNIIKKLADLYSDLKEHLLSFGYIDAKGNARYADPQPLFKYGHYYSAKMGNTFSLKSILPALYPDDPEMNYKNLEGSIKNGAQAMTAIPNINELTSEEVKQLEEDLIKYCALDTYAVVKIIKKLYEAI